MVPKFIWLMMACVWAFTCTGAVTHHEHDEIIDESEEDLSPSTEVVYTNRSGTDQASGSVSASASSEASCSPGSARMCSRTRCVDHVTRKVTEVSGIDVMGRGRRFPCSSTKACPVGKFCVCSKFKCVEAAKVPGQGGDGDLPTCRCPCDKGPCPEPCVWGACTLQACYPMPLPCDKE